MQTYLFYDLETSGLSPSFDQVYQFAAIRTDLNLNEIERYEILVKPTIDVIPTPQAMITHRLALARLEREGMPEHEAIFKIHQLLNSPGTISVGYNTLSFDDSFLRFNFYRHLLSPYTHQFANQCSRMDLFPVTVFYWLFRRDHLRWGTRDNKLSLKLELLSNENQLSEGPAHNAIVDVEATVNLARKLKEDHKMWQYLFELFQKQKEQERLAKLPLTAIQSILYPRGIAVNGKFGPQQNYQVPVLGLGQHWHYRNQTLWLRLDDPRIIMGDDALIPELWALRKRAAEPPFVIEPQIRFNHMGEERNSLAEKTLLFLQDHCEYFTKIKNFALDFKYPNYPETDLDAMLYLNGFWTPQEISGMQRFWQSNPAEKFNLYRHFQGRILPKLALRFLGRFYRDILDREEEVEFADYLDQIWQRESSSIVDYQLKPRLTRHGALLQIEAIDQASLDEQQIGRLNDLRSYLIGYSP